MVRANSSSDVVNRIGLEPKTLLSYREDCGDSNITLPDQNDFEVAQSSSTHLSDLTFLGSANEVTVIGIGLEPKTLLSYREDCGDSNITLPYQNDFEVAQSSSTHLSDLTFLGSANERNKRLVELDAVSKIEAYEGISKTRWEFEHIKNGKGSTPNISVSPVNLILVPANESQTGTCILRTLGYTDPGYLCSGQLTEKSDVYSFGVVLVEILSQEKPISFDRPESQRIIATHFVSSIELEDGFFRVVDPQLVNKGNQEQVKAVAELAKRCLHMNSAERPLMKEVAEALKRLSGMCPTIV
ncbi:hypothetical protein ACLB2K_007779 [Fragaria x ananassa]